MGFGYFWWTVVPGLLTVVDVLLNEKKKRHFETIKVMLFLFLLPLSVTRGKRMRMRVFPLDGEGLGPLG